MQSLCQKNFFSFLFFLDFLKLLDKLIVRNFLIFCKIILKLKIYEISSVFRVNYVDNFVDNCG